MLGDANAVATIAVKDLEAGKQFYGQTLGLELKEENKGGVSFKSGNAEVFIYQSETAGSGEATCASWKVDDVAAAVEELKSRGVTFEHYDLPDSTREGDVHVMGEAKAAWFKDPDGNVLCVSSA